MISALAIISGLCLVAALAVYLARLHRRAKTAARDHVEDDVSLGESEWLRRNPEIRFRRLEGHDFQ